MAPNVSALLATRAVHWLRNFILFSSFLMISWAWLSSSHRDVKDCTEKSILKDTQNKHSASDSNTDQVANVDDILVSIILVEDEKQQQRPIMNILIYYYLCWVLGRYMQVITNLSCLFLIPFFLPNLPHLSFYS